jgi:hypothetical protein
MFNKRTLAVDVVMGDDGGEAKEENGGGNLNNNLSLMVHEPCYNSIRKEA